MEGRVTFELVGRREETPGPRKNQEGTERVMAKRKMSPEC